MAKKIFLTNLILAIVIIPLSLSYAYQAIVLSDKELDNVYAAGFDFDITAAYAFRAAVINQVVSQTNIAAVTSFNGNINNLDINNLNLAGLNNQLNSTLTGQSNFAAIVAKGGDILNALINNTNTADVENTLCAGNGSPGVGPGGNASAIVTQTNVAAVIALNGNVGGAEINNSNYAGLTNQGHSGAASQVNVAVVMAAGNILNTAINNAANVNGLTSSGGIDFTTLPGGIFVEFNHRGGMSDHTHVSQWNITFVKEGFSHHPGGHADISNLINNIVGSHH